MRKALQKLIDKLLERDFIGYLTMKRENKIQDITLASQKSLAKDWLKPEEDEVWADL